MTVPDAGGTGKGVPDHDSDRPLRCYRHPDRKTYVSCVRCGRPICPDCMRPAAVGFQCPEELKETDRSVRRPRTVLGGQVAHTGRSATSVLIALNAVIFVIMTASGTSFLGNHVSALFARFAEIPGRTAYSSTVIEQGVANGDWYRLVTAMFLHFGIVHIAANMYVLYIVGPPLEQALGRLRFTVLYLVAGFGGSVASFLFSGTHEIAAGASGAIFGLFGAYYVVARRIGAQTGAIVGVIVLNIFISVAIPNIDIRAHLGGLVVGGILGAILAYAPRLHRGAVQAGGFAVVTAILVVIAVARGADIRQQERQPNLNALGSPVVSALSVGRSAAASPGGAAR